MAKEPNLKVVVGADTSPFDKGMAKAKSGLQGFEKSVAGSLGKLGDALGLPGTQLAQIGTICQRTIKDINKLGSEGGTAITKLVAGMGSLTTAIAGLGIGAAVIAFKGLIDEANNFKSLQVGQSLQVEAEAFRDTVKQAMMDMHQETAKATATLMTDLGNYLTLGIQRIKGFFANLFEGMGVRGAWKQTTEDLQDAIQLGGQAAAKAGEILSIQQSMSDRTREIADLDEEIATYTKIVRDTSNIAERREAAAEAEKLIHERYGTEIVQLGRISVLTDEIRDLTGSTQDAVDRSNQAYAQWRAAVAAQSNALAALDMKQNRLNASAERSAAAQERALAAMKKQGEQMAKLSQMSDQFVWEHVAENGLANIDLSVDQSRGLARQKNPNSIQVNLEPVIDKEAWLSVWEELNQDVKEAFVDIAETIGSSLVDAFQGGGVDSLMSGFLKTIGGFAKKFGAALMSFGLAETAFFKSLTSMNPATAATAVAAGAALVAVGAALSSIASSVGGSRGYSSSNVASSSYGGYSGESTYGRTMTVEVVGTLRANGSVLEAVINGENNRKQNVT